VPSRARASRAGCGAVEQLVEKAADFAVDYRCARDGRTVDPGRALPADAGHGAFGFQPFENLADGGIARRIVERVVDLAHTRILVRPQLAEALQLESRQRGK